MRFTSSSFAPAPHLGAPAKSWQVWLGRLTGRIRRLLSKRRERLALARLDDHLLRDIGLSRAEALKEAAKPFWF
jgi:uncharacterized protein YjiS (DUF1127 family)